MNKLVGQKVNIKVEKVTRTFRDQTIEYSIYKLDDPKMEKKINALGSDVTVFFPGEAGTMDFKPFRTNVHIDETGIITNISNG